MPFRLIHRNVVVAGEFNRAIIRPQWLIQQNVVSASNFEVLVSDRPDAPALFKVGSCHWEVAVHRLLVRPSEEEADRDPGPLIARVLDILPYTPVSAIGHNFLFDDPERGSADIRIAGLEPERIRPAFVDGVVRREASVSFAMEGSNRLTVKIFTEGQGQRIDLNFHLAVSDNKSALQAVARGQEFKAKADEVVRLLSGSTR